MPTPRYTQWCLTFTDSQERSIHDKNADGLRPVEEQLGVIIYQLNLFNAKQTGFVNSDGIFILRKAGTFEYTTYFTLKGEVCTGYAK